MKQAAPLLMLGLIGCTHGVRIPPTNLNLYAQSSLAGMHGHPVGRAGARLDRAERAIGRRLAAIRPWVVAREGEAAVAELDKGLADEEHTVYWLRAPTEAEEWASIARARRSLGKLEKRMRVREERR